MGEKFADRLQRAKQAYLDIGLNSGAQVTVDILCVALRDPEAMGGDVWGRERIERLVLRMEVLKQTFGPAFHPDPEQDYMQAQLDGALREIFGDDLVPFCERHPYVRELKMR